MKSLKELKHLADDYAERFESEGFKTFFSMIQREMSAEYFASVQNHLRNLKFRSGVLISAELGEGNKGTHYVLRKQKPRNKVGSGVCFQGSQQVTLTAFILAMKAERRPCRS